mmetsp:Transcript_51940/g.111062  ORF Transcript_51940/g.111062 Transcript_51940/m.111062 type:complete len:282 (+) Transcript_51940:2148-2993(+)
MTPSHGTSPWLTRSPPNFTMPTIFSFIFAFLSICSSSGRSDGTSGVLSTFVRKMCWHFCQMHDFPSNSGLCLATKSSSFSQRSVYISVYWCCLLEASKISASRSSSMVLKISSVTGMPPASCGSVASKSAQSLSNFSGVNLLMSPRHCCCGPWAAFFFRAARALLGASLPFTSSAPALLDLASPEPVDLHPGVSSVASRPRRPLSSPPLLQDGIFDLHEDRPPPPAAFPPLPLLDQAPSLPPRLCSVASLGAPATPPRGEEASSLSAEGSLVQLLHHCDPL